MEVNDLKREILLKNVEFAAKINELNQKSNRQPHELKGDSNLLLARCLFKETESKLSHQQCLIGDGPGF